jgi:hypothetical protein
MVDYAPAEADNDYGDWASRRAIRPSSTLIARAVFAPMPGSRSIRSAIAVSWASVVMFSRSSTFQALSGRRRPRMGPSQSSKRPLCICFSSRFDDWLGREWERARTARLWSATRAACASLIRITVLVGKSGRRRGIAELRGTGGSARLPRSLTPVRRRSALNHRCASMERITRTFR